MTHQHVGSEPSAVQRMRPAVRSRSDQNVGDTERLVSLAAGAGLAVAGLFRRGISGVLMTVAGAALVYHGAKPHSALYDRLGITDEDATTGSHPLNRRLHVRRSVTILRTAQQVYAAWKDPQMFRQFKLGLTDVKILSERTQQWTLHLPKLPPLELTVNFHEDTPGKCLAWRTLGQSPLDHEGIVTFTDSGHDQCVVTYDLSVQPAGGVLSAAAGAMAGRSVEDMVSRTLMQLRQLMEAGEVATNQGPSCRR